MEESPQFSLDSAMAALQDPVERERASRNLSNLSALLQSEFGLSIRSDSKMTYLFCTHACPDDPMYPTILNQVVMDIASAQKLYQRTPNLQREVHTKCAEVFDVLKAHFPNVPDRKLRQRVLAYVPAIVKIIAE